MLPRWRDQVQVFVHPARVVLMRVSRGLKPRVTDHQVLPCTDALPLSSATAWEAPVASLTAALRDGRWQGASAHLVLSNHFVRYALVPWSEQLADSHERQAYLRHCFGIAYGEVAKHWDLRMNRPQPGAPSLASGIEQALLASLRGALAAADVRLDAVNPHLMMGANLSRRQMPPGPVWLVMVEHGHLCLSLLDDGVWKLVRSYSAKDDWQPQLETLLAREAVLSGDAGQDWPVVLYWPESRMAPNFPGRKVTLINGPFAGEIADTALRDQRAIRAMQA